MSNAIHASSFRWRILVLLMVYAAFGHFNRLSMAVAGTERLIPDYKIDETTMGMVYTAFLIAYAALMTPGGWFIDRVGPRIALATMGFGGAVTAAMTGATFLLGPSLLLTGLFVVRSIGGALNAPLHPGAARMVSHWFSGRARSAANGMVSAGALCGIAAVPLVFGAMMDRFGWPLSFVIAGVATALLALLWTRLASDGPRGLEATGAFPTPDVPEPPAPVTGPLRHKALVLLTLSYVAVGYVMYLFFYWLEHYLKDILHVPVGLSRLYTTIANLSMAFGMAAGGLLADAASGWWGARKGRALVAGSGLLLSAALVAAGAMAKEPIVVVIFFSFAMAAVGATEGPSWSTATDIGGRRAGLTASIVNTGGNVGGLLAPVVTPLFARYYGWQASITLAAIVSVLGALAWAGINPATTMDDTDAGS